MRFDVEAKKSCMEDCPWFGEVMKMRYAPALRSLRTTDEARSILTSGLSYVQAVRIDNNLLWTRGARKAKERRALNPNLVRSIIKYY